MNKAQLIDALAERLGDRKLAANAVATLVDVVIRTVNGGERVTITGFGVFEKRARAARTARNPRTGQAVAVGQTDVPTFRPGTLFREVVSGTRVLPETGVPTRAIATPPAGASSRPATRVTAATRPAVAHVAPAKAAESPKAAKAAKVAKAAKATKATKAAKAESKTKATAPGTAKATAKATAKKAGKKTAGKKAASKK